ncbi:BQ5605_C020g09147 [Microbotryum silenes-dioicae]|uniref:BQ5605_C020g09147 protein n=1 Tax=Microbotryum silenes-dioicae TaxID=796604 RepID=A0A2X0MNN2_9BASI|nr:BQ5605_C020g09147 [Microbotryum silenes-dioicae]
MATAGASIEDVDYYALLELAPGATEQQIRTAYRKKSLKVHPDRNRDDPTAAALFHDLTIASQVLLDPIKRASFDKLRLARQARAQRFSSLDSKRKAMAEDLERREQDFKKQKGQEGEKKRERQLELMRLQEEARRMKESRLKERDGRADRERDEEVERKKERLRKEARKDDGEENVVALGLMDTTLTLKWPKELRPKIKRVQDVIALIKTVVEPDEDGIDVVLSADKIPKGRCSVKFRTISAAVRLMQKSGGDKMREWRGLEVGWAAVRPPVGVEDVGGNSAATKKQESEAPGFGKGLGGIGDGAFGSRTTSTIKREAPSFASSFPSVTPLNNNDETDILARLRQKERERLMEQMRVDDEADEAGA